MPQPTATGRQPPRGYEPANSGWQDYSSASHGGLFLSPLRGSKSHAPVARRGLWGAGLAQLDLEPKSKTPARALRLACQIKLATRW